MDLKDNGKQNPFLHMMHEGFFLYSKNNKLSCFDNGGLASIYKNNKNRYNKKK